MVFQSNTDMVRHYCKELLADGQEHAISEIRAYVNKKTGKKGIDGELLSPSIVGSALHDLSVETRFCSNTRRGYYKKGCALPQGISTDLPLQEQICERLKRILADARREICSCLTLNVLDCPRYEEVLEVGAMGKEVLRLLEEAERIADPALALRQPEDTAPAPPDPATGSHGPDNGQGEPEKWPRMGLTL